MRLRVLGARAAQGLVHAIAREVGIEIDGSYGDASETIERVRSGERSDIVILTKPQIGQLAAQQLVLADTVVDLGAVPTSIAVRRGQAQPGVGTAAALREALLAAEGIFFPDPAKAPAGIHFARVLERLGIADAVAARFRNYPNGATAMAALAHASGRAIGCTQSTDIVSTPGVQLVAPLPPGLDLRTVHTAAVRREAGAPEEARRFVEMLADEAHRTARRDAGFE